MKRAAIVLLAFALACQKTETARRASSSPKSTKTIKAATPPVTASVPTPVVGDAMPDYSAAYLDGKSFSLAAEKGNVVLVNLWATWCGPCRMEIPQLQKIHEKYQERGFKVVGVSVDEGELSTVQKFVGDEKVTYPVVIDPEGKLAVILQTTQLPTSFILDRKGKIVWRQVGALTPNEVAGVETVIEKALKTKA